MRQSRQRLQTALRPSRTSERGAVLVEYTLILAVFVLVSVGAVGVMNDNADDYFEDSSDHIGSPVNRFEFDEDGNRPGANTLASTTTVTAPPTTSTTTSTTTTPPATTSTVPATTSTTTTAPPATTTTFVTTTTQQASLSTSLSDVSEQDPDSRRWHAIVRIHVVGTSGANVSGLSIAGSFTKPNGNVNTRTCTTNASGVCTMTREDSGRGLEWWDFEIDSIGGPTTWTGTVKSIRLMNPY